MDNKKKVALGLLVIAIAFGAGFFAKPAKVKTEVKEVIKTVTVKEAAVVKIVYKDRIVHPDGTIEEHERSDERSHTNEGSSTEASRTASKEVTRDTGLTLQALAIFNTNDLKEKKEYGIYAKKRIFGNISIGALVTTSKQVGIGLGMDF